MIKILPDNCAINCLLFDKCIKSLLVKCSPSIVFPKSNRSLWQLWLFTYFNNSKKCNIPTFNKLYYLFYMKKLENLLFLLMFRILSWCSFYLLKITIRKKQNQKNMYIYIYIYIYIILGKNILIKISLNRFVLKVKKMKNLLKI